MANKRMKFYLFALVLCLSTFNAFSRIIDEVDNSNKLVVLWTSDNLELARTMVFMYTYNAKKNAWFDEVTLIIWGPSAKLTAENEDVQKEIARMKAIGVKIEACIACAKMYDVDVKLIKLGYDVKGMGIPLSDYLKQNYKVLTF